MPAPGPDRGYVAAVHTAVSPGPGFALRLLLGGSGIDQHRAGVLSLEGCPFVHSNHWHIPGLANEIKGGAK